MPFRKILLFAIAFVALSLFPARAADAPPLSAGEIDALTAPVALYPDQLLAKVLMAATYPLEIVEADRWSRANSGLKGAALDNAIARQSWDDSVKSLAHTPTVLKMMSERVDWTQKLGDAFLAQQSDVMDSVQRLRQQAQASGSLKDTSQQKVVVQDRTIVIEPAQPDVVYVPYYNPQVVYGAWAYPSYPPYYWPPPPGYAYGAGVAAGIGFVTGAVVTAAFWNNAFNWHDHNVYVNNNINIHNNFNRNTFNNVNRTNINGGQAWRHDPAHRQGVNYGNANLRQQYGRKTAAGADARQNFRGFDNTANGANNRLGANGAGQNRIGGDANSRASQLGNRGSASSSLGNRTANGGGAFGSGRSGSFGQGERGGGFDGIGSGASTRQFSSRGQSSMRSGGQNFPRSGGMSRGGGHGFRR
jgi:Protein of unknown function (DUF3300)